MTGRTHDLAAFAALSAIVLFEPLQTITLSTAIAAIVANQIGGIAPDIDQPTAPLWRNLPAGKYVGKLIDRGMGGHRFLTHSLLGIALFGFLTKILLQFLHPLTPHINDNLVWWAFIIGMISHLVMDSFTKEGVPWFLPIPVKIGFPPMKDLRITTGKMAESFFVFPAIAIGVLWLYASHYNKLLALIHQYVH